MLAFRLNKNRWNGLGSQYAPGVNGSGCQLEHRGAHSKPSLGDSWSCDSPTCQEQAPVLVILTGRGDGELGQTAWEWIPQPLLQKKKIEKAGWMGCLLDMFQYVSVFHKATYHTSFETAFLGDWFPFPAA